MKTAPNWLKPETRTWVNAILRDYELEDRHVRILGLAGEAWERMEDIREILARDGAVVQDRFGQTKGHPLLAEERSQKRLFASLLRELGLDLDAVEAPRKPRRGG